MKCMLIQLGSFVSLFLVYPLVLTSPPHQPDDTLGFVSNLDVTPAGEKPKSYVTGFMSNLGMSLKVRIDLTSFPCF